jgi:2-dehydropantoate 2-reductase
VARVAVVGVGAIGAAVAAALQGTGRHELMLCARRPLAGRPTEIFAHDDVRAVASALARECAAVARAEGIALGDGDADDVVRWLCRLPPDAAGSILTDRLAGRELEWEARNGVVGRLGRGHGVPTPVSDTVAALLHAAGGPAGRPA